MNQYISIFLYFFSIILKFYFFTYLYHPLYIKCNIQQKIKKKNKIKTIHKPKSIIAFIYFIVLFGLLKLFTFKVILFLVLGILFGGLIAFDIFTPMLNDFLEKYNKMFFVILLWKIFHTIFTLIYFFTNPINNIFNSIIKKRFSQFKNMYSFLANIDSNSFDEKNIDDINMKMNVLNGLDKNDVSDVDGSRLSQYFINSSKSKSKSQSKSLTLQNQKKSNSKSLSKKTLSPINSDNDDSSSNIYSEPDTSNTINFSESNENNYQEQNEPLGTIIEKRISSNISGTNKCDIVDKITNINNIFADKNTNDIEDISFTLTPQ